MFRFVKMILAALAVFSMAVASPALAASKPVKADINQIFKLLQAKGHKVEIRTYEKETFLRIKDDDFYAYRIFFYGCDEKGSNCQSVQFFASFEPAKNPTLTMMNEYSRDHRFGRVYLDKEGFPAIEWDLNLAEGMSEELFYDNLGLWEAMVEIYGEFLFGKNGENNKPD